MVGSIFILGRFKRKDRAACLLNFTQNCCVVDHLYSLLNPLQAESFSAEQIDGK